MIRKDYEVRRAHASNLLNLPLSALYCVTKLVNKIFVERGCKKWIQHCLICTQTLLKSFAFHNNVFPRVTDSCHFKRRVCSSVIFLFQLYRLLPIFFNTYSTQIQAP